MSERMVRVYDFRTRQVTDLPSRELASGMVLARVEGVEGVEGEVWVDSSRFPHGEYRPPPLNEEQQARV